LLIALAVLSTAHTIDDNQLAPDVSILSFDWKYAGYGRAETVSENDRIPANSSTAYKISRRTIYVFKYTARVTLKNSGAKTIKSVSWDYVFADAKDQKELKRYKLQSRQQILPGQTQAVSRDVGLDPKDNTQHISIGKQSVEITRIEYADGSVWQRPSENDQ